MIKVMSAYMEWLSGQPEVRKACHELLDNPEKIKVIAHVNGNEITLERVRNGEDH